MGHSEVAHEGAGDPSAGLAPGWAAEPGQPRQDGCRSRGSWSSLAPAPHHAFLRFGAGGYRNEAAWRVPMGSKLTLACPWQGLDLVGGRVAHTLISCFEEKNGPRKALGSFGGRGPLPRPAQRCGYVHKLQDTRRAQWVWPAHVTGPCH